jgi:hypothetical protein
MLFGTSLSVRSAALGSALAYGGQLWPVVLVCRSKLGLPDPNLRGIAANSF